MLTDVIQHVIMKLLLIRHQLHTHVLLTQVIVPLSIWKPNKKFVLYHVQTRHIHTITAKVFVRIHAKLVQLHTIMKKLVKIPVAYQLVNHHKKN